MSGQAEDRLKFLRGLRAVREYTAEPVATEVIESILEAGRWGGSASNRQPVEIVVVRDQALLRQLPEHGVRAGATAPLALLVLTPGEADKHDIEVFDNGRMVERLLLAAHAHGLGSNISTLKGEGPKVFATALGIPEGKVVWTVVTIGYIDREARKNRVQGPVPAGRKASGEFAHWDRY